MPLYEWKRQKNDGGWEFHLSTEYSDRPPGKGWKRVYTLSISSVAGAGGSPARRVDTRGTH